MEKETVKAQGRPTKYLSEYDIQVQKLCRLGATDKEIADFFDVAESTIYLWKLKEPSFSEALKKGKIESDMNVANSLYNRAKGYDVDGKHIPADTTAIIYWLKNRRPNEWRDRQDVNHDVSGSLLKLLQGDFFGDQG
jgi:hypothetical protein